MPASRKKRFPVAKRSPKASELVKAAPETNEKVSQDLRGIFGSSKAEKNGDIDAVAAKKKRSSDDSHPPATADKTGEAMHEHSNMMHAHVMGKKQKRDISDPDDDDEADNENGMCAHFHNVL